MNPNLLRLLVMVLGTGSLAFTASDPERLRLKLGQCTAIYHHEPDQDHPTVGRGLVWSGCEEIAKEAALGGGLLILGAMPAKRDEDG